MSEIDVLPEQTPVQKTKSKKQSKVLLTLLPVLAIIALGMAVALPGVTDAERKHRRWHWNWKKKSNSSQSAGSNSGSSVGSSTGSTDIGTGTTNTKPSPTTNPTPTPVPAPAPSPTPAPTTTTSTMNVPFLSSLVGYWKLDGNANGALGKDNGKVIGNVTYVPGKFGQAAHFDGKSYIEIPDKDYFSPSTFGQKTTVSFWFRPDTYNFTGVNEGYVNFLGKSDFSTGSEWEFRVDNETAYDGFPRPERMNFYAFNKTAGLGAGSALNKACPLNTWTHVVGEIDGANTKLYINGKLVDQDALSDYNIQMSNTTTPLRIGTSDKEAFLQGSISNLMIYNRNLSDAEVAQLYNTNLK